MTVTEANGRLEIIFSLPNSTAQMESVSNIKPTATDQDLYDIGNATANFIDDTLSDIRRIARKSYSA